MYEDKGVGVETYLIWLKLVVLCLRVSCTSQVSTYIDQNEAMTSAHGGLPRKRVKMRQDVRDVSILSCNKMIFLARQE